jgi:hypothetical protein
MYHSVLNIYEKTSGAIINLNTTVGMFLGRWKNQTPKFKQIKAPFAGCIASVRRDSLDRLIMKW